MGVIIGVLAAAILALVLLFRSWKRAGKAELLALEEYLDASRRLLDWVETHRDVPIGSSPAGTALVLRAIEARKAFIRAHPFITDKTTEIDFLYGLLNRPA